MITALILNREIVGAQLLARRVLLSRAAVAGRRRPDLEMDPAAPGPAQLGLVEFRLRADRMADRPLLGLVAGIGVSVWAHMGFFTLILLAGLQAIPRDLYEAAEMDGTKPGRVFWRITLPLLMPNLLVVIMLALIRAVQIFDEVYVLTGGGPGTSTLYLTQYIYEVGFASLLRNPGLAAAASILMGGGAGGADAGAVADRPARRKEGRARMSRVAEFSHRRRGGKGWHWTDVFIWVWLIGGLVLMFGPALWLVMSSFKTPRSWPSFRRPCCPMPPSRSRSRVMTSRSTCSPPRCRTARPR
jgi:ABC-type glycerol-3-phosphate transport system permease component